MHRTVRPWLPIAAVALSHFPALAQPPAAAPTAPTAPITQTTATTPAAPAANAVAATVNGQPISELAVQRALKGAPPAKLAEMRSEILDFLVDNLLVDQYLAGLNLAVEATEVDAKVGQIKEEMKKQGQTYEKVLQDLMLTETDLRTEVLGHLRWDKFLAAQSPEESLKKYFEANRDMFDGSTARARHILLKPETADEAGQTKAKASLLALRKEIEDLAAKKLAEQPAAKDNLEREKTRMRLLDEAFAVTATQRSACPSKAQGGDVGWFPRAGSMVEPFAKAAFALKQYEMSDVVTTGFGCHLILATDRRPGKDVKFEDVKDEVREVYGERLREAVLAKMKPIAKIGITPAAKP